MKTEKIYLLIILSITLLISQTIYANNTLPPDTIWKEFTTYLKEHKSIDNKIVPYYPNFKKPLEKFIKILEEKVPKNEWNTQPKVFQFENKICFLTDLTEDKEKNTYCFTFFTKDNTWYFQHLETITIRLDKIKELPTSSFPDISPSKKNWIRNEIYWTEQIRLFNYLTKKESKKFAYNWFKDGAGYVLAAKTWVPFFPVYKAFILYLCWEQSNLRGNTVTLESLSIHKAEVKISNPIFFTLYKETAHLKQQINYEDYYRIYESIWKDRASNAGWKLKIDYNKNKNELWVHFKR